jgi:hypothetical protein
MSALPTDDSGCGLLPTPTHGDAKASGSRNTAQSNAHPGVSLTDWVNQDGGAGRMLPTPDTINRKSRKAMTASRNNGRRSGGGNSSPPGLEQVAELMMGIVPAELEGLDDLPPRTRAMLPTPQSYSQGNSKSMPGLTPLDIAVRPELAKHAERAKARRAGRPLLPSPTSRDHKDGTADSCRNVPTNGLLGRTVLIGQAGPMRLNPQFVVWMMGYPPGWLDVECRPSRRSATP